MELTDLQMQVFERAKEMLDDAPWFQGVCLNDFPTDASILRDGIEDSAADVAAVTALWDAPDFFN